MSHIHNGQRDSIRRISDLEHIFRCGGGGEPDDTDRFPPLSALKSSTSMCLTIALLFISASIFAASNCSRGISDMLTLISMVSPSCNNFSYSSGPSGKRSGSGTVFEASAWTTSQRGMNVLHPPHTGLQREGDGRSIWPNDRVERGREWRRTCSMGRGRRV